MLVFYDLPPIPLQRHWPTSPLSTFYFGWSTLRIYFQVFKSEIAWKNVQLKKDSYQSKKREKPEKGTKKVVRQMIRTNENRIYAEQTINRFSRIISQIQLWNWLETMPICELSLTENKKWSQKRARDTETWHK